MARPCGVAWVLIAVLIAALFAPATPATSQQGTVVGTVVDETTGEALVGARVSLSDARLSAVSDSSGVFRLDSVPPGESAARVEVSGYAAVVEQIEVLPDEVLLFQFRLRRLEVAIQGLIVRARERDAQGSSVSELTRGDRSRTALDLLRERVPGVMVRTGLGSDTAIRIRSSSSFLFNEPAIYLDGVLVGDGGSISATHVLEQLPAERVTRIRVLHGPSAAARHGDSARGVILVETR